MHRVYWADVLTHVQLKMKENWKKILKLIQVLQKGTGMFYKSHKFTGNGFTHSQKHKYIWDRKTINRRKKNKRGKFRFFEVNFILKNIAQNDESATLNHLERFLLQQVANSNWSVSTCTVRVCSDRHKKVKR